MHTQNTIALALKYRPTLFSDLVGQNAISQTLSLALDTQHISHAYLFSGLRGSGKTSSARIFARALECENGPTSTPCGTCASCQAALQGKHLDIIEMDAASSRGIDDIKRVIEQTKYRPSFGRYKIFIIDEVHMLSKEAFNALLKTLEEPPEYVKFILATTDPLKLPATILSRTQHFRFKQIPHKLVIEHIGMILNKEGVSFESQALDMIARAGGGSLRDTLTLLDQAIIFCKNHIEVGAVSDMLGIVDPQVLSIFFQSIINHENTRTQEILLTLQEYECEMILDEMMLYLKDRLLLKDRDFPPLLLDRFARILTESKSLLNLNTDGSFVLLLCMMKMQEATKVKDIESMIEELEHEIFDGTKKSSPNPDSNPKTPLIDHTHHINTKSTTTHNKTNPALMFKTLIHQLKDRSLELGESFERSIEFVGFENNILQWESHAQEKDKKTLKEYSSIIKSIVHEVFGSKVQIQSILKAPSQQDSANSNITPPASTTQTYTPSSLDSIPTQQSPLNSSIESTPPFEPDEIQSQDISESTPSTISAHQAKQDFIAQNRDVIEAISKSVGIKAVIEPQFLSNEDSQNV